MALGVSLEDVQVSCMTISRGVGMKRVQEGHSFSYLAVIMLTDCPRFPLPRRFPWFMSGL
jgi:hypothetical protein